jgi:hypothetical protein
MDATVSIEEFTGDRAEPVPSFQIWFDRVL